MAGGGITYGANFNGAYSVMGAIDGFTAEIKTDAYVASVLKYTWNKLSAAFDLWMDMDEGPSDVDGYMHVYKWPSSWDSGNKPDYASVMRSRDPRSKLWEHVYAGPARDGVASFVFKDDDSFTPVNPILQAHNVKTGVHIFVHKATVMEYGLPVNISIKLAKYLAFVSDPNRTGGTPGGFLSSDGQVLFHPGTINVRAAGGSHTKGKFGRAFKTFYGTRAADILMKDIMPRVEMDMYRQWNAGAATIGQVSKTKYVNMTAWASANQQAYGKAKIEARRALKALGDTYSAQAAQRRATQYGE